MKDNNKSALSLIFMVLLALMVSSCSDDDNPLTPQPIDYGGPVTSVYLDFYHYMDLDSGLIDSSGGPLYDASTDIWIAYNGNGTINGRLFHQGGREIAKLVGAEFANVTVGQADSATFQTSLIIEPFDTLSVLLIKTDLGSVYKIGNPVEISTGSTFDYALMSTVTP